MYKLKEIIKSQPRIRKFALFIIGKANYNKEKKRKEKRDAYNHLCKIMINDPVIYVNEFNGIFKISKSSDLFRRIFVEESYEIDLVKAVEKFFDPNKDFVDVGANVGFYSVLFAKTVNDNRKVLSIEPTKSAGEKLIYNLDINSVTENIILYKGAVSNRKGEVEIHTIEGKDEYSSISPLVHPSIIDLPSITYKVPCITLDELVEEHNLDPGFIKIDVEGAEEIVLKGSQRILKVFRPVIFAEVVDKLLKENGTSEYELIEYLKSFNYKAINPLSPEKNINHNRNFTNLIFVPEKN